MAEIVHLRRFCRALLRATAPAAAVTIGTAGAMLVGSSPASAAPATDSIYVINGPTNTQEALPAATPDVVTPLVSGLEETCNVVEPLVYGTLLTGYVYNIVTPAGITVCSVNYPHPIGLSVVTIPPVGVALPAGYWAGTCTGGIALYSSGITVGVAPPGSTC